jgi:beta-galactosidase/beta-glucuronidase
MTTPRPEYPRPEFAREDWLNLNGVWQFEFDDANIGLKERWFEQGQFSRQITVPFAYQTPLSGIGENAFHDCVWYRREFTVPQAWAGKRILLHFGAVDYRAWVWVNGSFAVYHEGGHTPFSADISAFLNPNGANTMVVRVEDFSTDKEQPRGKQYWEVESKAIFYTRTTGLWQTVWLEPVAETYLERVKITPNIDNAEIHIEYFVAGDAQLETEIAFGGKTLQKQTHSTEAQTFSLNSPQLWSPEQPNLYDLTVRVLRDGQAVDEVSGYFGMRKISIEDGKVLLNNQPYYMRLVLDQGYNPEGLLTFPSDDYIKREVELTKTMGFNGARKHQKVEEPRYLYWADRLGLLVWGEMANAYNYSAKSVKRVISEWQEAVQRDYNHPCIVAWVPINESWGVPNLKGDQHQIDHLLSLYYLTKSLDSTRPVISNDGWEHAKSDICSIHDYTGEREVLSKRYSTLESALLFRPADKSIYVKGHVYHGEPVLVTEFGGIAFRQSDWEGWGYNATAANETEFIQRYRDTVEALLGSPLVQGFCYTQLTDVEQEINGLLTYDRRPKVDVEIIRRINLGE